MGDFLRFMIAAEGSIIGAQMLAVNLLYFKVWRSVRQSGDPDAGLLPKHIVAISLSYAILAYGLVVGNLATLGQPENWRHYLYVVGLALGIVALHIMGKRQTRRICIERNPVNISVESSSTVRQRD